MHRYLPRLLPSSRCTYDLISTDVFDQPTFVDLDADGHLDLVIMFRSIGVYYRNVPSNGSASYVADVTDTLGLSGINFQPAGPVTFLDA